MKKPKQKTRPSILLCKYPHWPYSKNRAIVEEIDQYFRESLIDIEPAVLFTSEHILDLIFDSKYAKDDYYNPL